jgi:hypothetical protein
MSERFAKLQHQIPAIFQPLLCKLLDGLLEPMPMNRLSLERLCAITRKLTHQVSLVLIFRSFFFFIKFLHLLVQISVLPFCGPGVVSLACPSDDSAMLWQQCFSAVSDSPTALERMGLCFALHGADGFLSADDVRALHFTEAAPLVLLRQSLALGLPAIAAPGPILSSVGSGSVAYLQDMLASIDSRKDDDKSFVFVDTDARQEAQ